MYIGRVRLLDFRFFWAGRFSHPPSARRHVWLEMNSIYPLVCDRELTLVLHTLGYLSFKKKRRKSCVRRRRRRRIEQYKNLNRLCSDFFLFARRIKKKELIPTFPSFLIHSVGSFFLNIFLRLFYSRQTYTGGLSYSSSSSSLYRTLQSLK